MEEKKLPAKRPISFSKANEDVNRYLQQRIESDPSFNLSDYICKLIRKAQASEGLSDELKLVVKDAVKEALMETNFTFQAQNNRLDEEELEDRLTQLMNL